MSARRHASRVVATLASLFFLGVCGTGASQRNPEAPDAALTVFSTRIEAYASRGVRPHAKEGDIFTPDVADMFRMRLAEVMRHRDRAKIIGRIDDESWPTDAPVVNGPLREKVHRLIPSPVLPALPPLPAGIEYRMVGGDLVLWDADADIVIDVLPAAFCEPSYAYFRDSLELTPMRQKFRRPALMPSRCG